MREGNGARLLYVGDSPPCTKDNAARDNGWSST